MVVGDGDGVVVLPAADFERVVTAGRAREAKEQAILARLRAGESTLEIYGWDRSVPETT